MPRGNKRNTKGLGNIRPYTNGSWKGYQARYTAGIGKDGKQIQKSIYGKTKEEVRRKLTQILASIDNHTYIEPTKVTLEAWLNEWLDLYVKGKIKPSTYDSYTTICREHLIPMLGGIKLAKLDANHIQRMYNDMTRTKNLSSKTVHNVHGVLHKAMEKAIQLGYIKDNPCEACELPRKEKKEMTPMNSAQLAKFLELSSGDEYADLFFVTVFTGMREGEVLGLTWDCVNLVTHTIEINKQLTKTTRNAGAQYVFASTKNGKSRKITVATSVIDTLRSVKEKQDKAAEYLGSAWKNEMNLVFTNGLGEHLAISTVYNHFKRIVRKMDCPYFRFHDLRHTYAVISLESGDDIKTVQENLGHATSSFTLDAYGHVSQNMRLKSASNMEKFIRKVV